MCRSKAFEERFDTISIIRPMRQITSREAGFFNHFNGVRPYVPKLRGSHVPSLACALQP
jgi:hypothetical protein